MRIHEQQEAIGPRAPQADRPHQQSRDDAPLHVEGVLWNVDYIGGIHNVGVRHEGVAHGREKRRRRRRVARVTADLSAYPGGNEVNDIEARGVFEWSADESEYRIGG